MSGYRVRSIDALPAIHHGAVKLAGAELGVQSFGVQVLDFPAGFADYPEHDHSEDGQEEIYVVLRGSAELAVNGDQEHLEPGRMAHVAPGTMRKLTPGPDGVRILAIGCSTDRPYERPSDFEVQA